VASAAAASIVTSWDARGVSIELERQLTVVSLRRFDERAAAPAALITALEGLPLPAALKATSGAAHGLTLAWRSPTEVVLLSADAGRAQALEQALAAHADWGCSVDQTGGVQVWRLCGARIRDCLERIGSADSMPGIGEARVSRIAELPVLAIAVREDEVRLLVERAYSDHLRGWMADTAADFGSVTG
jgi:heterotetrameric sarcosine oxidase gamma subunit